MFKLKPVRHAIFYIWATLLFLSVVLTGCATHPGEPVLAQRIVQLGDDSFQVTVALKDDKTLKTFGPRFDQTATIRAITLNARPLLASGGMPDEFGLKGDGVLGFDAALGGGSFIKIGVGRLQRTTAKPYNFAERYSVLEAFPITIKTATSDTLVVAQIGGSDALPWRYNYEKTYRVAPGNQLVISYLLTNTGTEPIEFEHYNHHWFTLGGTRVGPAYRVTTGFPIPPPLPVAKSPFAFEPQALQPLTVIPGAKSFYYETRFDGVTTVPAGQNHLNFSIGDASVQLKGDFAPSAFAVFGLNEAFCPEIFHQVRVLSGQTTRWSMTYQFSAGPAAETLDHNL